VLPSGGQARLRHKVWPRVPTMKRECETGASQRGSYLWNMEAEESTLLKAVTRRQPVKTQQTADLVGAIVDCNGFRAVKFL
jgi:hypothetical protein